MGTDVVIVVGGVEFHEHSWFLCSWSEYFETALHSGMKETTSKRFEFPERDPKEWELVVELAAPYSEATLTKENVHQLLSWFDQLCCASGLKACDNFLAKEFNKGVIGTVFSDLEAAFQYNLNSYKNVCIQGLCHTLEKFPSAICKDTILRMCSLMKDHELCRERLWGPMMKHLPDSISEQKRKVLFDNDLLSEMLHLAIHSGHQTRN